VFWAGKIGWLGFKHLVIACLADQITIIGHPDGVLIRFDGSDLLGLDQDEMRCLYPSVSFM
jgi:hypothetical protein